MVWGGAGRSGGWGGVGLVRGYGRVGQGRVGVGGRGRVKWFGAGWGAVRWVRG